MAMNIITEANYELIDIINTHIDDYAYHTNQPSSTLELHEVVTKDTVGISLTRINEGETVSMIVNDYVENYLTSDKSYKEIVADANDYIEDILIKLNNIFVDELNSIEDSKEEALGKTTRLADYYVQEMFNNPGQLIEIVDHTEDKYDNEKLLTKVKLRLLNEHDNISIFEKDGSLSVKPFKATQY